MRKLLVVLGLLMVATPLAGQVQSMTAEQRVEAARYWDAYTTWLHTEAVPVENLPAIYRSWWDELLGKCDCTPQFDFVELQVYTVRGTRFKAPGRSEWARGHRVPQTATLVLASAWFWNKGVVQHEMLHAMLNLPVGEHNHPPIFSRLYLLASDIR